MLIYFWERHSAVGGRAERERETQNPKQAPGSEIQKLMEQWNFSALHGDYLLVWGADHQQVNGWVYNIKCKVTNRYHMAPDMIYGEGHSITFMFLPKMHNLNLWRHIRQAEVEGHSARQTDSTSSDLSKIELSRGSWVAQSVKHLTLAQVMISRFMSSSPVSGSVLTAWSLEPALDSVSLSLSLHFPAHARTLSLSKINKLKKTENQKN